MNGFENKAYLAGFIISNIAGLILFMVALKKPKAARILFSLLFGWACWRNYTLAVMNPREYLAYADLAIGFYRDFINGWFSRHIGLSVSIIAVSQGMIAAGMLLNNGWVKTACIGAVIFLLSIAPLGVGSAFPFSITVSAAALIIFFRDNHNYIWQNSKVQNTAHQ